jgi:hypothetical protein
MEGQSKKWPPLSILTANDHLQILHDLCTFQLFDVDQLIRPGVRDFGNLWRIETLGKDKSGNSYWFLADSWLYTERGDQWTCIAWDLSSWQHFLSSNNLLNSRRSIDKQLFAHIRDAIWPSIEPMMASEDRARRAKLKREQAELQRVAYLDSSRRSSRVTARAKIQAEMRVEMEEPRKRALEPEPERPLTREERVALRHQKVAKMEEQKMIKAFMETASNAEDDMETNGTDDTENTLDAVDDVDVEGTESEADPSRSPIKLIVRLGPDGPSSQLFIGDEAVEKADGEDVIGVREAPLVNEPLLNKEPLLSEDMMVKSKLTEHHSVNTAIEKSQPEQSDTAPISQDPPIKTPKLDAIQDGLLPTTADIAVLLTDLAHTFQ